jgi:exosortase
LNQNDYLSVITFSSVVVWIGGIVLFYGLPAFRKAVFPAALLFFMVPMPTFLMERVVSILQEGSAEAAFILFNLSGVPVLREGFIFHLPNLSIEVAEQCSGIHSAIALFITSILAGKLFLATGWRKGVLVLSVFPITIMKNGLRIVTLSLLGNNLDERILSSPLHKQGGIPFFLLAVSFLLVVLWLLRRFEKRKAKTPINMPVALKSPDSIL